MRMHLLNTFLSAFLLLDACHFSKAITDYEDDITTISPNIHQHSLRANRESSEDESLFEINIVAGFDFVSKKSTLEEVSGYDNSYSLSTPGLDDVDEETKWS